MGLSSSTEVYVAAGGSVPMSQASFHKGGEGTWALSRSDEAPGGPSAGIRDFSACEETVGPGPAQKMMAPGSIRRVRLLCPCGTALEWV